MFRTPNLPLLVVSLVAVLSQAEAWASPPRGFFVNSGRFAASQAILDLPYVTGVLIIEHWSTVEPVQGVFDWTSVDERVDQAAANGKQVRLAIHSGGIDVPDWIEQMLDVNGGLISSITATSNNGVTSTIPAFWDDTFLEHKRAIVRAMAERYADHAAVTVISVAIADPFTGDWGFYGVDAQSAADAGYDSVRFASAWRDLIREIMVAAPTQYVATAVGSTPRAILQLVNPGEDQFFAFETALQLMMDDPDVDLSRLVGGKGSLNAKTPNPTNPSLEIPADLLDWRTIYTMINSYGAHGFAQPVASVTIDPEFKMNLGEPYGGPGEASKAEIFWAAVEAAAGYDLLWLEPWQIDLLNDGDAQLQDAIAQAAVLLPEPRGVQLSVASLVVISALAAWRRRSSALLLRKRRRLATDSTGAATEATARA